MSIEPNEAASRADAAPRPCLGRPTSDDARAILADLARGKLPADVGEGCEYAAELRALTAYLSEIQSFVLRLAAGDLTATLQPRRGPIVGGLKALQANLRHLTWQVQRVSEGDFTQRVDFMGEFSQAFNSMVDKLSQARSELVFAGTHDPLTGLFNRAFFDAELARLKKGRAFPVSVAVVDLDGLKRINDHEGHAQGDQLIRKAASTMTAAVRAEDVVARVGGDEFVILLPTVDETIGAKILARLRARCEEANAGGGPQVSYSIGFATAHRGEELDAALKRADELMYADKAARKAARTP